MHRCTIVLHMNSLTWIASEWKIFAAGAATVVVIIVLAKLLQLLIDDSTAFEGS